MIPSDSGPPPALMPQDSPAAIPGILPGAAAATGHGARLAGNSLANMAGRAASLAFWVVVTPYVLHHLGAQRFGLWSLLFVFTAYMLTMDLGVGSSMGRFVAELTALGRLEELSKLIGTASAFYLALSLVFVAGAALLARPVLLVLRIPPGITEAPTVLLLCALAAGVTTFATLTNGILTGFQRLGAVSALSTAALVPSGIGIWLTLRLGYGLVGLVWVQILVSSLVTLGGLLLIRRYRPELPFRPLAWHPDVARRLFGFSFWVQIANVIGQLQMQVDKLFLARWAGITMVTTYELGFRVSNGLFALPALCFGAVQPAAADFAARGDAARLRELHVRGMKWIAAFSLPLFAAAWVSGPWLLRGWLGEVPVGAALTLRILALSYTINILTGTGTSILWGMGRPRLQVYCGAAGLAVHLALGLWLTPRMGLSGALIAQVVSNVVWATLFWIVFHRAQRWPWGSNLWRPVARPALVSFALYAVLAGGVARALPAPAMAGRLVALALGVAILGVTVAVALALQAAVGQFDRADLDLVRGLPPFRHLRRP